MSARVTIAGGGLAGMTAAVRLAERGYAVKLYEQKSMLGGNLASRWVDDRVHLDVYPHMYLNWYHNFWALLDDTTDLDRAQLFRPMQGVKQLRDGEYPRFTGLTNPYRWWTVLRNMYNGPEPPADLYLFFYAAIDLMAEQVNPTLELDDVSVNGFLHARPYMTERTAELFNNLIINVWGIPSYLAAGGDYQDFIEYSAAAGSPPFWLARGPAQTQVIAGIEAKLKELGVEIATETQVVSVACADARVQTISLRDAKWDPATNSWIAFGDTRVEEVDELLLCVPPAALTHLVRSGENGTAIVDAAPITAEVSRLISQHVPLLYVFFTRRLRGVPAEPVGLAGSRYGLAFTDVSQTWQNVPDFGGDTVLALSSSDPFALPGTSGRENAWWMLRELLEFLDLEVGAAWGDSPDVDWDKLAYSGNLDSQLFVNETGSDVWRPDPQCELLPNLTFAGDFTQNRIGMTTIESAVTSGLEAVEAIVKRRGGKPVVIRTPRTLPRAWWVYLRYACLPYAASASVWSKGTDVLRRLRLQR